MKIYIVDKRKKDRKEKQQETKVFEDICRQELKEIKQFFCCCGQVTTMNTNIKPYKNKKHMQQI